MPNLFNSIFFLILFLSATKTIGQNFSEDSLWLASADFHDPAFADRKIKFMTSKSKNPIIRYNPVTFTFSSLMYFYQGILSPQIASNCAYKISCSNFSKMCIYRYGLIKGVALSADRLIRCTQFSAIDIDEYDIDRKESKIVDDPEKYSFKK